MRRSDLAKYRPSLDITAHSTSGILSFVLRTRLSDNNSLLDRQIQRQVGDILQALAIHHHCQQIGSIVHTQ